MTCFPMTFPTPSFFRFGARRPIPARCPQRTDSDSDSEGPGGPGWFDSSWDLQQGLEVSERLPEDAMLNQWIEICLRS